MQDNQDRLNRLERQLIEQEHRSLKLIENYIHRKEKWPNDEALQNSAKKAIIWRFLFSPTVIAFTGGTVAILTLFAFIWQNYLMKEQNDFLRRQLIAGDMARNESIFLSDQETASRRQRAVVNYLKLVKSIAYEEERIDLSGANLAGCNFKGPSRLFTNVDFNDVTVDNLTFSNMDLSQSHFFRVKKKEINSIWGFSSCNLKKSEFTGINFKDFVLYNCDLKDSKGLPTGLGYLYNNVILENNNHPNEGWQGRALEAQEKIGDIKDFTLRKSGGSYVHKVILSIDDLQKARQVLIDFQNQDWAKLGPMEESLKDVENRIKHFDSIDNTPIILYIKQIENKLDLISLSNESMLYHRKVEPMFNNERVRILGHR